MSEEPKPGEKKIIVDEDWKSQVEAEREAARHPEAGSGTTAQAQNGAQSPLPPPSLSFLASGLYLQGMISLGLLPNPGSDKPESNLEMARHTIDTLEMLREKTEGNRTEEETREIDTMLHELRLGFVSLQSPGGADGASRASDGAGF